MAVVIAATACGSGSGASSPEISLRSATGWKQRGNLVGHTQIGDRTAVITDELYQRCLTWAGTWQLVHSVCSGPSVTDFLPSTELVKIASSLR